MVFDYTNVVILIVIALFFIIMNVIGYVRKKAWFEMTTVILSLAMLIVHILLKDSFEREILKYNVFIDFVFLGINIPLLIIVDEIESRRDMIKSVFGNKYNKK